MSRPHIFFCVSLFLIYILVRNSKPLQILLSKFGERLLVSAFPVYSEFEQSKLALLRVLFGVILVIRAVNIQLLLIPEELFSAVGIWSLVGLGAAIAIMIGLFTQWAFIFMALFMWHAGDAALGTGTLGNDVGAILSLVLFLSSSGRYCSVDSFILGRYAFAKRILLYLEEFPSPKTIALAKFVGLLAYWCVCVYSLAIHINEPAWTSGSAGPLLLTNNFMSAWHPIISQLFVEHGWVIQIVRVLMWLMMAWYALVLPFVLLGGIFKTYVILWGLAFFSLSLIILNLGSLAEIEFIFWAALFWTNTGLNSKKKISIFFDDKCNLCDKTIQIISYLDIFGRIKLMPISTNGAQLQAANIKLEDALLDLYGVVEETGVARAGYDFYILLSKYLVLLWPLVPILYLGRMLLIGPYIYKFIANRRVRLFGVCTLSRPKAAPNPVRSSKEEVSPFYLAIICHVMFLAACYLIGVPAPYIGITGLNNAAIRAAHYYGITPINVFNKTDLKMAENWFVLREEDGTLVPIFSESGARLSMHKSDRVYFGNTVKFRRSLIGEDECVFARVQEPIEYLGKVFLHSKGMPSGRYSFQYEQYHQPLPDSNGILEGHYKLQEKKMTCSIHFEISYAS